jgi:RNA-directed DNA polymerase
MPAKPEALETLESRGAGTLSQMNRTIQLGQRTINVVQLRKRSGGFRTIYVLSRRHRHQLSMLLEAIRAMIPQNPSAHGFVPGRSIVTNAKAHVGYRYSLTFDFEDFFDSVTNETLFRVVPPEGVAIVGDVCFEGAIRQGPPTSPDLSNLAAEPFDREIRRALDYFEGTIAYTRYADDLTFSFNDPANVAPLREVVHTVAAKHGFKVHPKKEHLQDEARGRRYICGIAVDAEGIHAPRRLKRRLRAARHQENTNHANGLEEFLKLKEPKWQWSHPVAYATVATNTKTTHSVASPKTPRTDIATLLLRAYVRAMELDF